MKNIAIYSPDYALPIPAVGGGAIEELVEILIDKNEENKDFNFFVFQPKVSKKQLFEMQQYKYENTKLIFVNQNKVKDFFIKIINKGLKFLKIDKRLSFSYESNCLKLMKKHQVEKIVFEGNCPRGVLSKLSNVFGRDNLYLHLHSQVKDKKNVSPFVGNLIGVSKFVLDDWQTYFNESGDSQTKNHLLHNCVRGKKFSKIISSEEALKIRAGLGFEQNDFIIIFCGRILKIKGIEELMMAITQIQEDNIKLMIIGSPDFSRKIKSKFLENVENLVKSNKDRMVFTGYIDNSELYKYYQCADLQIVPSICEDSAPLVVIEGLKSGLPQICTISGGIPEYVSSNGTILIDKDKDLVENLKANIIKLYSDNKARQEMSKANIEQGKLFNETKYYKDFKDIMEE